MIEVKSAAAAKTQGFREDSDYIFSADNADGPGFK
jgi:hypothetical protein